jgi:hypothetical protein
MWWAWGGERKKKKRKDKRSEKKKKWHMEWPCFFFFVCLFVWLFCFFSLASGSSISHKSQNSSRRYMDAVIPGLCAMIDGPLADVLRVEHGKRRQLQSAFPSLGGGAGPAPSSSSKNQWGKSKKGRGKTCVVVEICFFLLFAFWLLGGGKIEKKTIHSTHFLFYFKKNRAPPAPRRCPSRPAARWCWI